MAESGILRATAYIDCDEWGSDLPPWLQAHITRPEQSKPVAGDAPPQV